MVFSNQISFLLAFCLILTLVACDQANDSANINGFLVKESVQGTGGVFTENQIASPNSAANLQDVNNNDKKSNNEPVLSLKRKISYKKALACPKISPNGKFLIATTEGNYGIYIFDNTTSSLIGSVKENSRIGFNSYWSNDSDVIFYKEKVNNNWKVYTYSITAKQTKELTAVDHRTIQSLASAQDANDPLLFINENLQISKTTSNSTNSVVITKNQSQYYNPILSPKKDYVLVHSGSMINLLELETGDETSLVQGIATAWHPNKNGFIYFLDETNDGHSTSGSEVYYYNLSTRTSKNLTKTPYITEMWPSISGDGKLLTCEDEKTGNVLVYTLNILDD